MNLMPKAGRPADSLNLLITTLDCVTDGILAFDAEGRLVLWNARWQEILPAFAHSLAAGQPEAMVIANLQRSDCGILDHRWSDCDGCRILLARPRTAEQDRDRTRDALLDAIDHLSHGLALFDSQDRLLLCNERFRRSMLEDADGVVPGMSFLDLARRAAERWVTDAAAAEQIVREQVECHRLGLTHELRAPDGRWVLVKDLRLKDGSTVTTRTDITELKRREQAVRDSEVRFRAIFQDAAIGIAVVQGGGRIVQANQALAIMLGYTTIELERMRYQDLVHPDYLAAETPLARQLLDGEIDHYQQEARYIHHDGRAVWGRLTVSMVRGEGLDSFALLMIEDIDERKRVQDELYKAKEAAEQANIAKTRFLAAASHDLRQPLQALSMFVAVLAGRDHSPEDASLIARIGDSVAAVETLLNGLLDVSKLEAGLVVPMVSGFNIAPVLDRLAAEFEPLAAEVGLELRMVNSAAMVRSDSALLERILRNLLNNAVRYTKEGRILFGCRRQGSNLKIEVWDTGIGIPESQLQLIFREFHQLGNAGRDRRQGLGLGLAIVERLGELLDHPIDVVSAPGKGSVFSVTVPLGSTHERVAKPEQLSLGISRFDAAVVVIEDEPDVLESTKLLLESWGYRVFGARDGDAAMRLLPNIGKMPDLILADYRLQNGATGGQAISRIRTRLKRSVPAIILTGDTAPERLRQAQSSGHGLLHKPVQPAALRQMIEELLAASVKGVVAQRVMAR